MLETVGTRRHNARRADLDTAVWGGERDPYAWYTYLVAGAILERQGTDCFRAAGVTDPVVRLVVTGQQLTFTLELTQQRAVMAHIHALTRVTDSAVIAAQNARFGVLLAGGCAPDADRHRAHAVDHLRYRRQHKGVAREAYRVREGQIASAVLPLLGEALQLQNGVTVRQHRNVAVFDDCSGCIQ